MQPWPTQPPPPGQNYYELGNVFSANGLTPQVSFSSKQQTRFSNNHRTVRNKRIMNHDHRQPIDQPIHQLQGQSLNNHRSLHGTPGNLSHHSNPTQQQQSQQLREQLITSQHVNSPQQPQPVSANAAMYKSQSILSHSSKSSDAYHSTKMPKDSSSYPVSSNVPQNISSSSHSHHHPPQHQQQQHYHQQQHHHPHPLIAVSIELN